MRIAVERGDEEADPSGEQNGVRRLPRSARKSTPTPLLPAISGPGTPTTRGEAAFTRRRLSRCSLRPAAHAALCPA